MDNNSGDAVNPREVAMKKGDFASMGSRQGERGCPRPYGGCTCDCHKIPGVKHIMPCCYPEKGDPMNTELFELAAKFGRKDKFDFRTPGTSDGHKVECVVMEASDVAAFVAEVRATSLSADSAGGGDALASIDGETWKRLLALLNDVRRHTGFKVERHISDEAARLLHVLEPAYAAFKAGTAPVSDGLIYEEASRRADPTAHEAALAESLGALDTAPVSAYDKPSDVFTYAADQVKKEMQGVVDIFRNQEEIATAAPVGAAAYHAHQPNAAALKRILHDFPILQAFYSKHALGPRLAPSCLCCGKVAEEVAIKHAELPGIVICSVCHITGNGPDAVRTWPNFEAWLASNIKPPSNATEYGRMAFEAGRAVSLGEAIQETMPITQEPKYGIRDNRLYNRTSGEFIPSDEPVFIFRARDRLAVEVLAYYSQRCGDPVHQEAVFKRMTNFDQFAIEHPDRMKWPDTQVAPVGEKGGAK